MQDELIQHFRCAPLPASFRLAGPLAEAAGFFRLDDVIAYGRTIEGSRHARNAASACDLSQSIASRNSGIDLPFDPDEVIRNLRYERYVQPVSAAPGGLRRGVRNAYYLARPLLPVFVRKHLQKAHLNGWRKLAFPKWPVDVSVDKLLEALLALLIRSGGGGSIPFIWFWPDGASACAVMTHDVETQRGVDLSPMILDMNAAFGIPASFQLVPEERYPVTSQYLRMLRERGQEINVQGLNHDGHLFHDKASFRERAGRINHYAREYGAVGFRSPVLYRNQDWFEFLEFEYDSSVPNVAHLDPQRGGCCTVMPYLVGNLVELPVTMTQDYSLFHILNQYSLDLWTRQIETISEHHGLINAVIHPDYMSGPREREVYHGLLQIYARMRDQQNVWVTLPGKVNSWWRQRSRMKLQRKNGQWEIEGQGSERARLAYASLENGKMVYRLGQPDRRTTRIPVHYPNGARAIDALQ